MVYRISHCSKSIENYIICVRKNIIGFLNRGATPGDRVYLAVKVGKTSFCSVRGILGCITDLKPWEDGESYVHCLNFIDLEFCEPFDLKILSKIGGKYWSLKYLQGAKPIKDKEARDLLDRTFNSQIISDFKLPENCNIENQTLLSDGQDEALDEDTHEDLEDIEEYSEKNLKIMGTFQTVKFANETDKTRGLETLVNQNFYELFADYQVDRTVLISENRLFLTAGVRSVSGIRGIPDALLLIYDRQNKPSLRVNLVEYECYGERKTTTLERNNYLNGHIIPQLMKFASAFSVVTDKQIRDETATTWVQKIINYVFDDRATCEKVTGWIRELKPGIPEGMMSYELNNLLLDAFKSSLQVILIIDELSPEQESTIRNVVNAFKLEDGSSIGFKAYVVRLQQRLQIMDGDAEYALSVQ
ncbi:hypothetical protein [Baaleninema sp.]|uniref:hypothetical protein n=1 Tax=Baaleninema sp. TaxID=3101197 RepID=UPI003CFFC3C7